MSVFPTPEQFTSWAGLCGGNHKSAGKQSSGSKNRDNPWLKAMLTECSLGVRKKGASFQGRFHRLKPKGGKKVLVAVTRSMLVVA